MYSAIVQTDLHVTGSGGRSRSNSTRPRGSLRCMSMPKQATMHPRNRILDKIRITDMKKLFTLAGLLACALLFTTLLLAQNVPSPQRPAPPPQAQPPQEQQQQQPPAGDGRNQPGDTVQVPSQGSEPSRQEGD